MLGAWRRPGQVCWRDGTCTHLLGPTTLPLSQASEQEAHFLFKLFWGFGQGGEMRLSLVRELSGGPVAFSSTFYLLLRAIILIAQICSWAQGRARFKSIDGHHRLDNLRCALVLIQTVGRSRLAPSLQEARGLMEPFRRERSLFSRGKYVLYSGV